MDKVIVLGSTHYNSIGVVQSLGYAGVYVILVMIGGKNDLITKSKYVKEVYCYDNYQSCIDCISDNLNKEDKTLIIPCGDEAALLLEKNRIKLCDHFVFQHSTGVYSINELMNKHVQSSIALKSGFDVPASVEIENITELPNDIIFPVILKPALSCNGEKKDIKVVYEYESLRSSLKDLLTRTNKIVVQQYIEKNDTELNILGYRSKEGKCIVPCIIKKLRVHPKGRGSVTVGEVFSIIPEYEDIVRYIKKYMDISQYIGLFSIEMMCSGEHKYFIEANYRNDALNTFVLKYGINLPYIHCLDLIHKEPITYDVKKQKKMKIICDPMHMASLKRHSITIWQWFMDIITSDSFLLTVKGDKLLFFRQIIYKLIGR